MMIKLEKGETFSKIMTSHCTIAKNNGVKIQITWKGYCKLINYRMIDELQQYDEYDRFIINNHYELDLEVIS